LRIQSGLCQLQRHLGRLVFKGNFGWIENGLGFNRGAGCNGASQHKDQDNE
jgi:hypothetical protein